MTDDATLLQRYATDRSETAFAELVQRHIAFVYAAAARRLGDESHRASDVTQTVFITLARNAPSLSRHPALAAWLYAATRNAAIDALRVEKRRRAREQKAYAMQEIDRTTAGSADWSKLKPVIDGVVDQLHPRDREAVLLRFFQGRAFGEIATVLGVTEDGARKRVDRALERLRTLLTRSGVTSTAAALGTILTTESAMAVPAGLAPSVTTAATAVAAATTSTAWGTWAFFGSSKVLGSLAALVAIGGIATFVRNQSRLAELQTSSANLHAQVEDLTKQNTVLAQSNATLSAVAAANSATANASTSSGRIAAENGNGGTRSLNPSASTSPESRPVVAVHAAATKSPLHERYDPFLIEKCRLTAEQADRFVELKLAIADVQADLQASMKEHNAPGGTQGIEALRGKLTRPMWDEIRALLGSDNYKDLRDYEMISAVRPMVTHMYEHAGVPLSSVERDQVARLLIKHDHAVRAQPTDLGMQSRIDWNAVVDEAAAFLAPAQIEPIRAFAGRLR